MVITETIRSVTEIEEINVAETSSQHENQENQEVSHIADQSTTTNFGFSLNVEKIKNYIPKLRTVDHRSFIFVTVDARYNGTLFFDKNFIV